VFSGFPTASVHRNASFEWAPAQSYGVGEGIGAPTGVRIWRYWIWYSNTAIVSMAIPEPEFRVVPARDRQMPVAYAPGAEYSFDPQSAL